MRIGIIADVHGRLESLREVLRRLDGVELIVNLGDVATFSDQTNECYGLLKQDRIVNLVANHEQDVLAIPGLDDEILVLDDTGNVLHEDFGVTEENKKFIRTFKMELSINADGLGYHFSHGHEVRSGRQVHFDHLSETSLGEHFAFHKARVNFCGHLHRSEVIELDGRGVRPARQIERTTTVELAPDVVYGLNVGMLCYYRNNTVRLCYAILDTLARTVTFIFS